MPHSTEVRGLDRRTTIDELDKLLNEKNPPKVNINPDGSLTVGEQLEGVAKQVAQLERDSHQLGEMRATLLLNFGDGEGCRNMYGFAVKADQSPLNMLVTVLEKFVAALGEANGQEHEERANRRQ